MKQPVAPCTRPRRQAVALAGATMLALLGCTKNEVSAASPPAAAGGATADAGRRAFDTASRGTGFVVGQAMAARTLLVFFDPQCPHCATLWNAAKPLRNRLRMVWMPVAFINPSSAPQAAMLLAASDGTALMDQHESLLAAGGRGLTAMGAPEAQLDKVKANTALWKSLQASSVPHLVYRAGADGPYGQLSGGLPTADLERLLGL
jgi:thiol:disulfide interchange protein DsbG